MINEFQYKVKWCPICNQGWVEIVKEKDTGKMFLCCSECETEWTQPDQIFVENGTQNNFGQVITPTNEDLVETGWLNSILTS